MTKKDYQRGVLVIGRLSRHVHKEYAGRVSAKLLDEIVTAAEGQLAHMFAEDNPAFNSFQFHASCEKERRNGR